MNLLVFLSCVLVVTSVSDEELSKWEVYIQEEVDKALIYSPPENSKVFAPKTFKGRRPKDFGSYDFIVVGAGSTGTVLANRLSEQKNWKILLLEAGNWANNLSAIPVAYEINMHSPNSWGYFSVPQNNSCLGIKDRRCPYPRGKVMGGSTILNGLIYSRGHSSDFDRWEAQGNPGWSYKDCLPFFKKSEKLLQNTPYPVIDPQYHGTKGELNVQFGSVIEQTDKFFKANEELGYNFVDINTPKPLGVSPLPLNIKTGKRWDGGRAFILPILQRKNLKVMVNSLVLKVVIRGRSKEAKGVIFVNNGQTYYAKAKEEVILSAGSINSPQLLMLSGIGPKEDLQKLGIKTIEDLEVGRNFHEHPTYYGLVFSSNSTNPVKPFKEYLREFYEGKGPLLTVAGLQLVGFYRSKYQTRDSPDLELLVQAANCTPVFPLKPITWNEETNEATYGGLDPTSCFTVLPVLLESSSKGSVRLKSSSPYDYPSIDPNMLSEQIDLDRMYEAVQLILNLTKTEALKSINATLHPKPLPACSQHQFMSKDYVICSLKQLSHNIFHPVGTCRMGPGGVVDHEIKVHGIQKLRVADASVFPFPLSGHPNAVCVMIGEKLSDMLKKQYNKI